MLATRFDTVEEPAGISTTSEEYYTLFCNSGKEKLSYWLASSYVAAYPGTAGFGMRCIKTGSISYDNLYDSLTEWFQCSYGVRPVVSLKSDIQIEKTETNDGSTLAKACIIK